MPLIDTHTHIYDAEFDLDRDEVVQRALDAGVGLMLLPNVDASTIQPMLNTPPADFKLLEPFFEPFL